jgi:acyl carrier protein
MSEQTIASRIIDVIHNHFGVSKNQILPATRFAEDLGSDSLDHIDLIMAIEQELDIEIDEQSSGNFATVQDLIDLVTKIA